ncbi:heparan-alpha-glucosaminide N-acetyltransferase domain-containing protein [Actinomycetospora cinnamomea]|uniref:Uncharacterized protein DUF1624 n=1 Tax=Actinomycetospora cinnamomea TaxID=663609 RepID=A0A2U1FLU7_9PSEU|nr:heparan-alpha-glucosaminide N-acetyltransferase domain-containing protein [Actinomycetospora cinnamomea]PVZ13151.1 uncharacterized protein DUF1624 [Actinomycetospora cinnamomea]
MSSIEAPTARIPAADPPAPQAHGPPGRLPAIDAARGVALLGMMAVHALWVIDAQGAPTAVGLVASGNAAALFAVLAGVGIAFTTGRARVTGGAAARRAAGGLVARGIVIGLIGLALGTVVDAEVAAVILPFYAVLFVLAVPLVLLPTPVLVGGAVAGAVGTPVLSQLVRAQLPAPRGDNPSLAWVVEDPLGLLRELLLTGYYPALSWVPYVAVGLALGRAPLRSPRLAAGLAAGGAALAAAAAGLSTLLLGPGGGLAGITAASTATGLDAATLREYLGAGPDGVTPTSTWWWLAVDAPHSSTPLDLARTAGIALAVIGLLLLLDQLGRRGRPAVRATVAAVRAPLAAAGALALTCYTLHVLFLNSSLDEYSPVTGYVVQVVLVLLLGLGWRASAGRGPLEALASAAGARGARWAGG